MPFLTENQIYSNLIDHRNEQLWKDLISKYTISVNDGYNFYKLDFIENDKAVCILVDKNYTISLFTHELLHLELRSYNINSLLGFNDVLLPNGQLSNSLRGQCVGSICNNIEHILFFDDFIELGFNANQFVMDYDSSNYPETVFKTISQLKNDSDELYQIFFFSTQITMLAEKYYGLQRNNVLLRLKKTDKRLYEKGISIYHEILDFNIYTDVDNNNQDYLNQILAKIES